jgi:hypothetical protein
VVGENDVAEKRWRSRMVRRGRSRDRERRRDRGDRKIGRLEDREDGNEGIEG